MVLNEVCRQTDEPLGRLAGYRSYPSALLLGAVGVAVEAGEHGARGHHLAGLVPAVGVAQAGGVTLALLIQDGVQPARQRERHTQCLCP